MSFQAGCRATGYMDIYISTSGHRRLLNPCRLPMAPPATLRCRLPVDPLVPLVSMAPTLLRHLRPISSRFTAAAAPTGRSLVEDCGSTVSVRQAGLQIHGSHYLIGFLDCLYELELQQPVLPGQGRHDYVHLPYGDDEVHVVDASTSWAPCALKDSSLCRLWTSRMIYGCIRA